MEKEKAKIKTTINGVYYSQKQLSFIEHYLKTRNCLEAAKVAGYSPNGIRDAGYRLLRNPKIWDEIKRRDEEFISQIDVTKDNLVKELEFIKHIALHKGEVKSYIQAVSQQAKLMGLYSPIAHSIEQVIKVHYDDVSSQLNGNNINQLEEGNDYLNEIPEENYVQYEEEVVRENKEEEN